ncbi:MAG: sigma 54-interacting transcriptional regulator [Clostridiales bacterium]
MFKKCKNHAWRVAKTDSSVMLVGNTGSGKEVFARAIHQHSNRANGPFLALNCAAIPETLIEGILFGTTKGVYTGAMEKEGLLAQANGGTLFLDEVNSMPITSQAKLLRVLEEKTIMKLGSGKEKEIDIRIISSTNEAPFDAVDNGHMREDLFYRLSVVQIVIPPLRERSEDIPKLVEHFIHKYNEHFQKNILGINNEVLNYFMTFLWPGNVRQLKSCVESAMNFAKDGTYISLGDLPQYMFESADTPEDKYRQWLQLKNRSAAIHPPQDIEMDTDEVAIMDSIWDEEKKEIITALRQSKGNITKAAKSLGMTRQSLSYRLKKYHLK